MEAVDVRTAKIFWSCRAAVLQAADDLPGSLGGFTGHPGRCQTAFDDFTEAIYAAIGTPVTPNPAPVLEVPSVAGGNVRLRFTSMAGRSYRVGFKGALADLDWTPKGDLAGTGATLAFSETATAGGFYRVTLLP